MNIKRQFSEEHRRKISEARKGTVQSEETKRKISLAGKGEKHYLYGKHRSEATKNKLSEINKGKQHSEEAKRKMSVSRTGDKNHFYGKQHSEETKRRISESRKGKYIGEKSPVWTGGKVEITCKVCGKKKKIIKAVVKKNGNSCSHRCNSIWNVKHSKKKDTNIEIAIEAELIKRHIPYLKQAPILGIALVDFLLPDRIVIQCDGDYWHNLSKQKERDTNQDFILGFNNYKVYRFTEVEINKSASKCINKITLLKIWKGQGDKTDG